MCKEKNKPTAKLTIAVPTFRRPAGLSAALQSLNRLQTPSDAAVDILVVDNDANATARPTVEAFSKESRFPVAYFVEPNRGLSSVRNRILTEALNANADFLAGIDDDAVASSDWLMRLWEGLQHYAADAVGGVQEFTFPHDTPEWIRQAPVFKPYTYRQTGRIVSDISTGNFLLKLDFIRTRGLRFSAAFNFTGGEDSDFFTRCAKKGAKIVWIKEAVVTETIPPERTKLNWILKRYYRIGHSMVSIRQKNSFANFSKSFLKILYYLPLSGAYLLIRKQSQSFKYFFRFFFHLGKLSACIGLQPRTEHQPI